MNESESLPKRIQQYIDRRLSVFERLDRLGTICCWDEQEGDYTLYLETKNLELAIEVVKAYGLTYEVSAKNEDVASLDFNIYRKEAIKE